MEPRASASTTALRRLHPAQRVGEVASSTSSARRPARARSRQARSRRRARATIASSCAARDRVRPRRRPAVARVTQAAVGARAAAPPPLAAAARRAAAASTAPRPLSVTDGTPLIGAGPTERAQWTVPPVPPSERLTVTNESRAIAIREGGRVSADLAAEGGGPPRIRRVRYFGKRAEIVRRDDRALAATATMRRPCSTTTTTRRTSRRSPVRNEQNAKKVEAKSPCGERKGWVHRAMPWCRYSSKSRRTRGSRRWWLRCARAGSSRARGPDKHRRLMFSHVCCACFDERRCGTRKGRGRRRHRRRGRDARRAGRERSRRPTARSARRVRLYELMPLFAHGAFWRRTRWRSARTASFPQSALGTCLARSHHRRDEPAAEREDE